ncbi:MAG: pilus assembly protein, partial [Steroidobacteraceae bacterium]
GVGLFGARVSVLSDIIDSSPTPVGPPSLLYPPTWQDFLISAPSLPENSGQSYANYATAQATRMNVVYVGANDGLLHGFRAGSFDVNGNFVSGGANPNDGYEVMAYMPGAVLNIIHNASNPAIDFANIQYGHAFYVDATPGNGDLFYNGQWHTWLVGGLGAGGAAIYALDVTTPGSSFTEGNAANVVLGEWTPSTLTCTNVANCGNNLGNTYGTPQIRRFHNGMWGAVFGNGLGSPTGDAGIYVMTVNPTNGAKTFYYFGTGKSGDGIAYAAPADIDGDHIVDYVYAGDMLGNLWRFDLTSSNPAMWGLSPATALFKTPTGQPITTAVLPLVTSTTATVPRVMIDFGTGQQVPLTNSSPTTYATAAQSLYGIWDSNMANWNSKSSQQFAVVTSPATVTIGQLQAQTIQTTVTSTGGNQFRTITSNPVCWSGSTTCSGGNTQFGWVLNLPSSSSNGAEQVIFNPSLQLGVFLVNTTVPASTNPYQCLATTTTGWTYGISPSNGGTFATSTFGDNVNSFISYNNQVVGAEFTNGTGSTSVVLAGTHSFLVMQTSAPTGSSGGSSGSGSSSSGGGNGPGTALPFNGPSPHSTSVTWVERR